MTKCQTCGRDYETHPVKEIEWKGQMIVINDCREKVIAGVGA